MSSDDGAKIELIKEKGAMKTLLIGILVLLLGCGGSKEMAETKKDMPKNPKKVVVQMGFDRKTDDFSITDASISGTLLSIEVEYAGGCKDHTFELFTDGSIMKSLPPKQSFFLRHYANEESCEALIQEKLLFDLTGSTTSGNSLIILLEGFKGDLRMDF